jgi:hypothetical protein
MRILIFSIACACIAGCTDADNSGLPVQPWGGANGGGGGASSTTSLTGRVCLVSDARVLAVCSDVLAGGMVVSVGNLSTLTQTNGAFTLVVPTGTSTPVVVSSQRVVTTTMPLTQVSQVPVLPADLFNQVLVANGIALTPGSGTILASVVDRGGNPVVGAIATSTPSPAFGPFFDGTTPNAFTLNGTGARGVVLFPGVTVGPAMLTFSDLGSTSETTVDGVQVIDGGITIVDAVLP